MATTKKQEKEEERELWGISNDGKRFLIPKTRSPLAILSPSSWSVFDWIKNSISAMIVLLFLFTKLPMMTWVWVFLFFRLAYNLGLGYILNKQSNTRFLTLYATPMPGHPINDLLKSTLSKMMDKDYNFDSLPPEFNAWVFFRGLVEIILQNDLLSYFVMFFACLEIPKVITPTDVAGYIIGIVLSAFALWAKTDAYRVVSDFAWYWGDFFFLVDQNLTFNRVFALFPHPMYTLGYAFFYGLSIIAQSYTFFYASLFAHITQLIFLSLVENPHIEKTYNSMVNDPDEEKKVEGSNYFRRDLIVFKNFDIFRSSDAFMLIICVYCVLIHFANLPSWFYITHAVGWRLFHSFGLGYVLRRQSKDEMWSKRFVSRGLTKKEAFEEWKRLYNLSLTINYFVMIAFAFQQTNINTSEGLSIMVRMTVGLILICINIWSSVSTFEALGEFGWFYGDFFLSEFTPKKLYYTGIYRYFNNPDSVTGFAGYYGLSIISGSWIVFGAALFCQICNFIFIKFVETPHMKKLYGGSIRDKDGYREGITEIIKTEKENLKRTKSQAEALVKEISQEFKQKTTEYRKKYLSK